MTGRARLFAQFALIALAIGVCSQGIAASYIGIVKGLPGEDYYESEFSSQVTDMRSAVEGVSANNQITVFEGETSTARDLLAWLESVAASSTDKDRLAFIYVGHGSYDDANYKFNLRGPDLSAEAFKDALDKIDSELKLVINTSSSSGALLEMFESDSKTIYLAATKSGRERNAPRFGRFFVKALIEESADLDKNQLVSVEEAFNFAQRETGDFYSSEGLIATEHAVLQGEHAGLFSLSSLANRAPPSDDPELLALYFQRDQIDLEIERLRIRRIGMSSEDYSREFRSLLVQLSLVQAEIDEREGGTQ